MYISVEEPVEKFRLTENGVTKSDAREESTVVSNLKLGVVSPTPRLPLALIRTFSSASVEFTSVVPKVK